MTDFERSEDDEIKCDLLSSQPPTMGTPEVSLVTDMLSEHEKKQNEEAQNEE